MKCWTPWLRYFMLHFSFKRLLPQSVRHALVAFCSIALRVWAREADHQRLLTPCCFSSPTQTLPLPPPVIDSPLLSHPLQLLTSSGEEWLYPCHTLPDSKDHVTICFTVITNLVLWLGIVKLLVDDRETPRHSPNGGTCESTQL